MSTNEEKLPLHDMARSSPTNENVLRPKRLSEYVGQRAATTKLEVFIAAAKARGSVLDHVLLSGPPGLGKTTLAHIIASEMGGRVHLVSGPTLDKSVDLMAILSNLQEGDVLFIDEIHRLSTVIEESLYPAMEDKVIQVILGEGVSAQSVTVPVQNFTLVGATTQAGKLSAPLRDRFGIQLPLDFYSNEEMETILSRSSKILNIEIVTQEICEIARRSRGTPRIGNHLLARVRDFVDVFRSAGGSKDLSDKARNFANVENVSGIELIDRALQFLDVDHLGLQPTDRRYLKALIQNFKGGPAGIESIAASLSEDRRTLEEMIEPYLLKENFILRTPRGRVATDRAYTHLGIDLSGRAPVQLDL
jgi:holliday junction DNA helicase RuvB